MIIPRRTVTALQSVCIGKRLLDRMQLPISLQSFYGRDLFAIVHQRQVEARKHTLAVHMHGAGAALPVITTFLGSSERHSFADAIQQRGPRIDV